MTKVFYDTDVDKRALEDETIAILGYGIQGRAQALTLRDAGLRVLVGNRSDAYAAVAEQDGFPVLDLAEASRKATVVSILLPDEIHQQVFQQDILPGLSPGKAVVFAHGFSVRYGLVKPPDSVDVLLLAPRMPGQYLRQRYLEGWGVPAFVAVERDATTCAWKRLLGLSYALGVTRCGAIEVSFAQETELDHFSEHFTYPLIFRALELAFAMLVEAGYPPEVALMELHGSGELGEVLGAASREGLYAMLKSHASPACQVGIAHYWDSALGPEDDVRARIGGVLQVIREGTFARHLVEQQKGAYPELQAFQDRQLGVLVDAERRLQAMLKGPPRIR